MKVRNEFYYIEHISDSSLTDEELKNFTVRYADGMGLVNYLRYTAETDERNNLMRTYIVRDKADGGLVGYFSLKAGMVSSNEFVDEKGRALFNTLPCIELANFAMNDVYIKAHPERKGHGLVIFSDFVMDLAKEVATHIGAFDIYIYALPIENLIKRYTDYGFARLNEAQEKMLHARMKPIYDEDCIFMYQRIQ